MKLLYTLLFSFVCLTTAFAQEQEPTKETTSIFDRKHEVKLSTIKLLASGIFEASYEFIQNKNTGFGASLLLNLDAKNNSYPEDYSLTPFYRMYFQTNEDFGAKGFFVEGFTSFYGGTNYDDFYSTSGSYLGESDSKFFDIAMGIALGKKWINSSGFVFEAKAGVGRNLLGNSNFDALFKGDLSIGYRFN